MNNFIILFLNPTEAGFSSVIRALACRVGGNKFDSWDQTNTHGLNITEK